MTIVGSTEIVGPKIRVIRESNKGITIEYYYEGTSDALRALSNVLRVDVPYTLDETNPPKCTLVYRVEGASYNDTNPVLDAYFDMRSNTQQKSLYEHPDAINLIGITGLKAIRDQLKATTPNTSGFTANQLTFYNRVAIGADYFFFNQPVFKTVQIIKNRVEYNFAVGNQNAIYTNAQVVREANPFQPFPTAIVSSWSQMHDGFFGGSIPSGYMLGWLKQNVDIVTMQGNKISATIEYVLDAWPTGNFGYPASTVQA